MPIYNSKKFKKIHYKNLYQLIYQNFRLKIHHFKWITYFTKQLSLAN